MGRVCVLVVLILLSLGETGTATCASLKRSESARISLLVATGMPGGTYHRVGLGMASLWTTKLRGTGIRVSAVTTEGSRENIDALRIADADIILADALLSSMAYGGTGVYRGRPLKELRSITGLWPDAVHIVIRAEKIQTGTLSDLEGLTLATGLPDSGQRFTTDLLLKTLQTGKQRVKLRSMSEMSGAEALKSGTVQAMDMTGGIPVPLVMDLFQAGKPRFGILNVTGEMIQTLKQEGWEEAVPAKIPAGTYPGLDTDVHTVGQANLLATTASLDPQVVYALTKTFYENLEDLAEVYPSCRSLSPEKALDGLNVPLHRGAILYYTERNVKIPEHLFP